MTTKTTINITDMTCASCAASNEKELRKTKGVVNASVNFASKKAYIEYDSEVVSRDQLAKVISANGYTHWPTIWTAKPTSTTTTKVNQRIFVFLFGLPFLACLLSSECLLIWEK